MILQEHLDVMASAPPGSTEWLAARRNGVGASEVAALLGLPCYGKRTQLDVWLSKMGKANEERTQDETGWSTSGRFAEPMIADRYQHERIAAGENIVLAPSATEVDGVLPYLFATPDRDVFAVMDGLEHPSSPECNTRVQLRTLEIKNRNEFVRDQWGAAGTDEIPLDVLAQVQTQLGVTGMGEAHVAVLIGGWDFRIMRVEADPGFHALTREAVQVFWETYVIPKKEPPLAGPSALDYVKRKWGAQVNETLRAATEDEAGWLSKLWQDKQTVKELEEAIEAMQALACNSIGTDSGLTSDLFKATWKAGKDATKVDRAAIIAAAEKELAGTPAGERFASIVAEFTESTPASRRFLLSQIKPKGKK